MGTVANGEDSMGRERIEGEVKRITFRSEDGYTVLKLGTSRQLVTCVGYFPRISAGDRIRAEGDWVKHSKYGLQFSVSTHELIPPRTGEGIARYLASGLIPGIGESLARRIVAKFGETALEVIDREPRRLLEVNGLGAKRVQSIRKAWKEQREISELIVFLESHGIRASSALRIYKHFGPKSISVVREDPYRLASEIWGIGFATADKIAQKLGVSPDAPIRVRAGIKYILGQACDEGHVFLPGDFLRARCVSLLGVDEACFDAALTDLVGAEQLAMEGERTYLPSLLDAEKAIVFSLRGLAEGKGRTVPDGADGILAEIQAEQGIRFEQSQLKAIDQGLRSQLTVVTGGPGTGKTTIIQAFVRFFGSKGLKVSLAAPTGRAAKRMSEITGQEAKTIHRLLEYNPKEGLFRRNERNPLDAHVVVIDEASMLDLLLASSLLKAIRPSTSVILVGDVDQLPPVGPGNFLRDMIEAGRFPVQKLTRIFRQEEGGSIVDNAHRINGGEFPVFSRTSGEFYLLEQENPSRVADMIVDLCSTRIPARYSLDGVSDIQVLSPMYKGDAGATNLNLRLQDALNPGGKRLGDMKFRIGDKVMQLRNNYEKMVFNGDLGRVVDFDPSGPRLTVQFDYRVDYDRSELDELTLAYAVTVHKSQGSEFPGVVMPLLTQHYIMLYRNLLYTAVTRARRLVVLVGTQRAVGLAVRNVRTEQRFSSLAERLSREIRI